MMIFLVVILELVLLAVVISSFLRERQALRRFVRVASDPDRLKDQAMQLPGPYRAPATQFAGELGRKGSIDELIVQGVTQAANTTFGFPLWLRLLAALAISCLALAPLVIELFAAATHIATTIETVGNNTGSWAFLKTKPLLEQPFADLYATAQGTAWIFVGLAILGTVHWLLNRSEAREARFVEALLEAAINARPGAAAPVASRLSELVSPERGLAVPIVAFVFFVIAAGVGWVSLHLTATVKTANAADVYSVWPRNAAEPLAQSTPLARSGGGRPMSTPDVTFISIVLDKIQLADGEVVREKGGYKIAELEQGLAPFKAKGAKPAILADGEERPFAEIIEVLDALEKAGFDQVYLVVKRSVSSNRIFAGILLHLKRPQMDPAFTLTIDGSSLWLQDEKGREHVDMQLDLMSWTGTLSQKTRKRVLAREEREPPLVDVEIKSGGLFYNKLIEILSAADTACDGVRDCGIPGLGLEFYLKR